MKDDEINEKKAKEEFAADHLFEAEHEREDESQGFNKL